jgi:hypothetical protein
VSGLRAHRAKGNPQRIPVQVIQRFGGLGECLPGFHGAPRAGVTYARRRLQLAEHVGGQPVELWPYLLAQIGSIGRALRRIRRPQLVKAPLHDLAGLDLVAEELRAVRRIDAQSRGRGGNRVQYLLLPVRIVDGRGSAELRRGDLMPNNDPLDGEGGEVAKRVRRAARLG